MCGAITSRVHSRVTRPGPRPTRPDGHLPFPDVWPSLDSLVGRILLDIHRSLAKSSARYPTIHVRASDGLWHWGIARGSAARGPATLPLSQNIRSLPTPQTTRLPRWQVIVERSSCDLARSFESISLDMGDRDGRLFLDLTVPFSMQSEWVYLGHFAPTMHTLPPYMTCTIMCVSSVGSRITRSIDNRNSGS
jgi:hypothetical protein